MVSVRFSFPGRWLTVAALAVGACTLGARETQEGEFSIAEDVVATGGSPGASVRYAVQDVIGQPIETGISSTAEFIESAGFIATLTASLSHPLDINSDGALNAGDPFVFSTGWHRFRGETGYRDRADFDGNLIIDRNDLDRYLYQLKEMP